MKKFLLIFFVLSLFAACSNDQSSGIDDEFGTDVVYDNSWKYITLYLDDALISVSQNKTLAPRAMTVDNAKRGFDYFEVVFYYGNLVVAQSSWEIGKRASVKGVFRTESGIDYGAAGISPLKGSAVLFAGRKQPESKQKTLLAVGKLVSVDDIETTVITDKSESVTFELSVLTASVSFEREKSSFLTLDAGNKDDTVIINAIIGSRQFPLYKLHGGVSGISAQYYFALDGSWSDFSSSIVTAASGTTDKRVARYPAGNGKYWYPKYAEDLTTTVVMTNNQTAGSVLQNPVTFSFNTFNTVNPVKSENGIFSFAFKIPVYPVSSASSTEDGPWYISPAYASYYYNIDNGVIDNSLADVNNGGAVLLGVDVPVSFEVPAERR